MILSFIPAAINHLMASEMQARQTLAAHAGKVACIDTGLAAISLQVAADGLVQTAPDDASPAVTIRIKLADLPLIASNRERAFSYVRIEGDADFANTISRLSQSLRWDAEQDLARVVGDIPAVRIVTGARAAFDTARSTQQKLAENLAEYFLEENPMLMRPRAVADLATEISELRDDVERLSKRIDKLKAINQANRGVE